MASRPEISIPAALATATVVYSIYNRGMPPTLDVRAAGVGDKNVEAVRKQNAWLAAATVAGISLIAKDATVFIVGGAMVVALDWMTRANIWTNPESGKVEGPGVLRLATPRARVATNGSRTREYAPSEGVVA
jgi:hypothetical protein